MTIVVTDPAVGEALTLAEAKAHLRLDTDAEDALIESLIRVAREYLEAECGLSLLSQGFRLYLDGWPTGHAVLIRKHPVRTLEAVTLYGEDGLPEPVDLATVRLETAGRPARLHLGRIAAPNGVEVDFTAGFGEAGADVPDMLKRAMLVHIARMFEIRGAVSLAAQPAVVPEGYERLVAPWRRRAL